MMILYGTNLQAKVIPSHRVQSNGNFERIKKIRKLERISKKGKEEKINHFSIVVHNVPIRQRHYPADALNWDFLTHIDHHLQSNHRSLAIQHQLID